ncbi:hypothetical protein AYO36_06680 [Exiguobacterium sp. KKBO11]|uniref:hypothetical protein n=1 Tax=unclassified Exiguobacterium TaxID=2644629 RepID=UPI0007D784EA|nr:MULTISPECIES: hypothetical protein [unclassified Exiguobacterium]OAI87218.1 hypothetical protein AYO36_06680 [Exiguobacterium sp. KKBO11]
MPVHAFKSIQPTNVNVIDQLLVNHLHAIRLNQDDERLITILEDPFVPPIETIVGVYCVYRKSILDLLQGRIASIESYDFQNASVKDKLMTAESVEGVLDMATFVVIASEDDTYMSHYFIGGEAEKLNSILNVCFGHPNLIDEQASKHSIKRFEQDVLIVEKMGFMKLLRNE